MKVLNWIIALCGLWEFADIALPFIIGFDHVQAFVWNHIVVGMILMFAGARAGLTGNVRTARTMDWIAAVAGLWLIIAPFLLGTPDIPAGLWNDIIVGVIVLILGVWSALASPRAAGWRFQIKKVRTLHEVRSAPCNLSLGRSPSSGRFAADPPY